MSGAPFLSVPGPKGSPGFKGKPVYIRFVNKKFVSYVCHWNREKWTWDDCEGRNCKLCLSPDKPMVRYQATVMHYVEGKGMVRKIFDMPAHIFPDVLAYARSMYANEWRRTWFTVWREGTGIHLRYNIEKGKEQ